MTGQTLGDIDQGLNKPWMLTLNQKETTPCVVTIKGQGEYYHEAQQGYNGPLIMTTVIDEQQENPNLRCNLKIWTYCNKLKSQCDRHDC